MVMYLNPLILTDGYKLDHRRQYPEETTKVYSNWTPRKSRIEGIDHVVLFGLQYFIRRYLQEEFDTEFFKQPKSLVVGKYLRRINNYLGPNRIGSKHIEALHDLGYLPIIIKALPEGSRSPIRCPQFTVTNTHPGFFWLVNYLETLMSCTIWGPTTSATLAHAYREIFEYWADQTGADKSFIQFQGHDFSMRGMFGVEAAMMSGAAHLLSFTGTDTVPAIDWLEYYYDADSDKELVGCSIAATEHAVMCVGTGFLIQKDGLTWEKYGEAEFEVFKRLITEVYPSGNLSIVSDTWDLFKVLREYLPKLKAEILAREGKIVIRPDSGDPVKILTGYFDDEVVEREGKVFIDVRDSGTALPVMGREICPLERIGVVEALYDIFGGSTTSKGHRLLHEKIGCIYGDSITLQRAEEVCLRLAQNNFASTNWVAGIGSFTYQYQTRDTFGFAMKATYAEANAKPKNEQTLPGTVEGGVYKIPIFKDPKTDDGTKKSLKGLIQVVLETTPEGDRFVALDESSWQEEDDSYLTAVFKDGKILSSVTLKEVRKILWPNS